MDPSTLRIIQYPEPALRRRAEPVGEVTEGVRAVAMRMIDLMHEAEGIGLAAPQVGLSWRMFVAHVPESESRSASASPVEATREPLIAINPKLIEPSHDLEPLEEGCLSLPDIVGEVRRPSEITIEALDAAGRPFAFRASGLLARCLQHETDHLDGVLILDRMTHIARLKNRSAIKDLERRSVPRAGSGGRGFR